MAGPRDLQSVEDRGLKGSADRVFVGRTKRLHALGVEDGLGDEEMGAGLHLGVGETGCGLNTSTEVYGASYAKVSGTFQGTTTTVKALVHTPNYLH